MSVDRDVLNGMTNKDLYISMYLSQILMFVIGAICAFVLGDGFRNMLTDLPLDWYNGLWQGSVFALFALGVNALVYMLFSKKSLDDGGLNERVFAQMSPLHILFFCAVVAFCEEWLFRAVLQQFFGLPIASVLFAFVHFRYVKKPVLFTYVLILSISLGLFLRKRVILLP
ncbi:CPBP family intramembrane glutamic endopeptidase [Bacillus sp. JCM 19041]|uniref:CPBP family glutamic-type intramembrane protease n=1 Tax=Bacillus sp. JCM 19041 TaxID=1460637 RepID=UPI0006CFCBD4